MLTIKKMKATIKENRQPLAMTALTLAGAVCTAGVARIAHTMGMHRGAVSMAGAISAFEEETDERFCDHLAMDVRAGHMDHFSLSDTFRNFKGTPIPDNTTFSLGRKER